MVITLNMFFGGLIFLIGTGGLTVILATIHESDGFLVPWLLTVCSLSMTFIGFGLMTG